MNDFESYMNNDFCTKKLERRYVLATGIRRWLIAIGILLLVVLPGCDDEEKIVIDEDLRTPPAEERPAWSPDGNWIVYFHTNHSFPDNAYPDGLYVIDTNGNNKRMLVQGYADTPDWSPDGKWIVFRSGAIYVVNFEGDSMRQVTSFTAYFPSWSPDGKKIAFDTRYSNSSGAISIWTINVDGANLSKIGQENEAGWRYPDWSPDGTLILHIKFLTGVFGEEIFIMDTSGNNAVRLTYNNNNDRSPKWSPDGTKIAWCGSEGLWIMDANGSNQRELVGNYATEPTWSPDSKKIIFRMINAEKNKSVLWVININGTGLKQITH